MEISSLLEKLSVGEIIDPVEGVENIQNAETNVEETVSLKSDSSDSVDSESDSDTDSSSSSDSDSDSSSTSESEPDIQPPGYCQQYPPYNQYQQPRPGTRTGLQQCPSRGRWCS